MISHDTIEEAMAARRAARRARIAAATVADHTPVPVDGNTARTMIAATGHTNSGITISASGSIYGALVAVGHHTPEAFMAAVHAITDVDNDPFGLLWDGIYSAIYVDEIEYADMADWGTEDVWHTHVIVLGHGFDDGTPGVPTVYDCHCIDHAWAMRERPPWGNGAIEVTVWRNGAGGNAGDRYADMFGPRLSDEETTS